MHKSFIATVFGLLLVFAGNSTAEQLSVPLQIDYSLIKKVLISQLYTGKGTTAELWNDRQGCSYLRLSNPDVNGKNGQIQLLNEVQARIRNRPGRAMLNGSGMGRNIGNYAAADARFRAFRAELSGHQRNRL